MVMVKHVAPFARTRGERWLCGSEPAVPERIVKGQPLIMPTLAKEHDSSPRPSKFIAEALVGRHGPGQITARANAIGLPRQLTKVIVVACTATATDGAFPRTRSFVSAN